MKYPLEYILYDSNNNKNITIEFKNKKEQAEFIAKKLKTGQYMILKDFYDTHTPTIKRNRT